MGDFKNGEPGFTTRHRNMGNDIASHNIDYTPHHDTPAPGSEYARHLPQAQSEEAYH